MSVIKHRALISASVAAAISMATAPCLAATTPIKIGFMVSSTGPAAVIGIPQRNSALLMPKEIDGTPVQITVLDDGGNATNAVNNVKKLISEDHVDALIGPSISPNAMAILNFVAESKTPLIAAVGTDAVIQPVDAVRKWVFKTAQANSLILQAEVGNMVKGGIKTLGLLRLNDALGEEWATTLKPIIDKAGIKLVADERFQRSDSSIAAQTIHLVAANPDAILVAAAGGTSALGQQSLVSRGYRGKIYQTEGAATDDFVRLAKKSAEGALMAAGPLQVVNQLDNSNPIKKVALGYIAEYEKAQGTKPSTFGSNVYDAEILLKNAVPVALKKAQPGTEQFRSALRDALENSKDVVGTQGVFNMTPENHNGMDKRSALMMVVKNGKWVLLK